METKNLKVGELLEMVKSGKLVREGYQRTPSHTAKKALEIVESLKSGKYCGILTFSKIDEDKFAILDGSSRLQDLEDYVNGKIFTTSTKTDTIEEGDTTKVIKCKVNNTFSSLSDMEKNNFLQYSFPVVILENNGISERAETFVNVNDGVTLSNFQKTKGNISEVIVEMENILKSSNIIHHIFSDRLIQKDEVSALCFQILANVYECYNATTKKLVENVNKLDLTEFDLVKFRTILDKFDGVEVTVSKYVIASHIVNLYQSSLNIEELPVFDNRILFDVQTQGANSTPANEKRLEKSVQVLNKFLGISVKTGKPCKKATAEVVSLEDIAE